VDSPRSRHARALFAGIAPQYERMGLLLSLGAEPGWRRFLVSRTNVPPGSLVLDVASGTGLVARELAARRNVRVVQLEPSEPMVRAGREATRLARLDDRVLPVLGGAERLPFPDDAFDGLTFTYLLRYVDDPAATMVELARVVRPGGVVASLEFHVPEHPLVRAGWWLYTRGAMPLVGLVVSPAWARTTRFLGPSIDGFYRRSPLAVQVRWWQDAGFTHVRTRTFLFGTALVIRAVKRGH
jgi:demethylmenaquinone methyltransferase/2-methoxy-6-polyprenyl-1,4-benzoquinol methylase